MSVVKTVQAPIKQSKLSSMIGEIKKDYKSNKFLVFMALPVVLWYIIFHYLPMYGVTIAFQNYSPVNSQWVGFQNFAEFFLSPSAVKIIRNTLLLNVYSLIFSFPAPIILALLLNEVRNSGFKRVVQTITYLPHFVSMVVICGIIVDFTNSTGIITRFLVDVFNFKDESLLSKAEYFRTIFIASGIWQSVGWSSVIYMASLAGIDSEQYEAATIDGANRWQQLLKITIPGIAPTIIILLIMSIGSLLSSGFEKIILLYNPNTYETADVIASYVYRRTFVEGVNYGYTTAVGLFNSVANLILLITANKISKKVSETSLW